MTPKAVAALLALELCTGSSSIGCSSASSAGVPPPGSDAGDASHATDGHGVRDVAVDVIVDPKNCVPPGAAGYCSPGGGQCSMAGPGGSAEICTGDLPETPAHGWYCTLPCSKSTACGGASSCVTTPMGARCIPKSCAYLVPDAGAHDSGVVDAAVDAAVDGPPVETGPDAAKDAPTDAPPSPG